MGKWATTEMPNARRLISMACAYAGMKQVELARRLGWSNQRLHSRYDAGRFSCEEWREIALALGAEASFSCAADGEMQITFTFPDGKAVSEQ